MANGEHIEIAKCYITVIPSLEGSQGTITKELTGATVEASDKAGKESGSKFGESFSKNLQKAGVAIGAVLAGAGAAAVGAGKSFVQAANDVSAMGDSIGDNAAKMGISTKAYQEWDFVLQRAGSSIDAMKTSMKTLQTAAASDNDAFKELGITQEELARRVGKSRSHITNMLGLLRLPNSVQKMVLAKKITMGHAKVLSKLDNEEMIEKLAKKVEEEDINVRKLEEIVQNPNFGRKVQIKKRPSNKYKYVQDVLREKIGTSVRITEKSISIPFDSEKDLQRILDIIKIKIDL